MVQTFLQDVSFQSYFDGSAAMHYRKYLLTSVTTLTPSVDMFLRILVFSGGICACWINLDKFSSLIPFWDWI